MSILCDFGCGREAKIQFKNGKHCCEGSVNKCPSKRMLDSVRKKGRVSGKIKENADQLCPLCKGIFKKVARHLPQCHANPNYTKGSNQYIDALREGRSRPSLNADSRKKLSDAIKRRTKEQRDIVGRRISTTIQRKIAMGTWHMQFQNQRIFRYKGVVLQSTWEYLYARFLDKNSIKWVRPKEGFIYTYKDRLHRYFPDFYLPEQDIYIEVKGRIIERDKAKWASFPRKLQILQKSELLELGVPIMCSEKQLLEY